MPPLATNSQLVTSCRPSPSLSFPPLSFPCLSNSSYNYIFHSLLSFPIESPSFSSPCTSSTQQTGSFTLITISLFLQVYVIQDLFCSERKELQTRERGNRKEPDFLKSLSRREQSRSFLPVNIHKRKEGRDILIFIRCPSLFSHLDS